MGMVNGQQQIMDAVFVKKRIGEAYAVWFEPSGSFVLFEKPAYEVFSQYSKNEDAFQSISKLINK
jgi:hypothetical protein